MNIIRQKTTVSGSTWAVLLRSNRYVIARRRNTGDRPYILTGYSYTDPVPALAHLARI